MSSASSTESASPAAGPQSAFKPWHFYLLVSLAGATWAVAVSPQTSAAGLLLLSAAILAAGAAGVAMHYALSGFFGAQVVEPPMIGRRTHDVLEREKALVLRSIKELEFDHSMGKVGEEDFADMSARLRARAVSLIEQLEQTPDETPAAPATAPKPSAPARSAPATAAAPPVVAAPDPEEGKGRGVLLCGACETINDRDARFCKHCGARL